MDYDYPDQWVKIDAGAGQTFTATALAICGHNFNTAGVANLVLQYSTDDSTYTNAHTAYNPADDTAQLKTFTSQAKRYWRLWIPTGYTAALELGIFFVGPYMEMPRIPNSGFDPDEQRGITKSALNQNGHLLGAITKYRQREISAKFSLLTQAFLNDTYIPFWESHYSKPFFWVWDITTYPAAVYLVRFSNPKLASPIQGLYRSLTLDMQGVAE